MQTVIKQPNDYKIRSAESFNHAIRIDKPRGAIDSIVDWAREEMTNEWRWQLVETSSANGPGSYIFYFDSESDYLAFVLKYS